MAPNFLRRFLQVKLQITSRQILNLWMQHMQPFTDQNDDSLGVLLPSEMFLKNDFSVCKVLA